MVFLLKHIGEEIEEIHEKQQRNIDGSKAAGAQDASMSGNFPCPPTHTGLWPVANPAETSEEYRGGAAAERNLGYGPDLSHLLLPHQRNLDGLSFVHSENKGSLA